MKLVDLIPYRLQSTYVMDYENAVQVSLDDLEAAYDQMTRNLHIDTASEWLPLWEKAYGITVDAAKDEGFRRAKVKAKMQGFATTTLEIMRQVAAMYSDRQPDIVENNPAYTFYIYLFRNQGSKPQDLTGLMEVIEEIKPAHLGYEIVIQTDMGTTDIRFTSVFCVSSHNQLPELCPPWDGAFAEYFTPSRNGTHSTLILPEIGGV